MNKVLSVSLRPTSLSALVGQENTVAAIRKHMAKRPPQTWLFHGPSGSGKTTIMQIISRAYQCDHLTLFGEICPACQTADFCIHEINASGERGVEEISKIADMSRYKPTSGHKRVIILDEAHGLSASAWKLLLKPLEEPPDSTVWLIGTTEPNKIPPTVKRRCTTYQMKTLGISAAEDFLKLQAKRAGIVRPLEPLFEQCHLLQVSAPALLLQALEKFAAGNNAVESVSGVDENVDGFRICKALIAGDWRNVRENLINATPDSARYLRASACGYLVGCMKRELNPRIQERLSQSLIELSTFPFDDTAMLHWLWGALWKVTNRFRATQ